jgi:SPP1 gp7 family putative phage head morphogenesis protein
MKMFEVSDDPSRFEEAIAWFRNLVPLTDAEFAALSDASKRRAFKVAGVSQFDLIMEVWNALDSAIEKGTSWEQFQKATKEKLESAWGKSNKYTAWRVENIYRTNVQSAYGAGRYKQLTDPDVLMLRPFWLLDAVLDSRTSAICNALTGTTLPAEDSFWGSHVPPLHFGGCRTVIRALTRGQANTRGITTKKPLMEAGEGFGKPPRLNDFEPDINKYPPALRPFARRKLEGEI